MPPKVMLIEDDALLRTTLARALEESGFGVLSAETGLEAIVTSVDHEIDALVVDICLPGHLNGWQIARHFWERRFDLPVIYISARPPEKDEFVRGGLFLRKPFRPADLTSLLRETLTRRVIRAPVEADRLVA